MDYETITLSDSKMASAALFIALRMNGKPGWNSTLEYYSGYKLSDFVDIVIIMNEWLHRKQSDDVTQVRDKYFKKSNQKITLLSNKELLKDTQHLLSLNERETTIKIANIRLRNDLQ